VYVDRNLNDIPEALELVSKKHLVCKQQEAKTTQLTKLLSLNPKLTQDIWLNAYLIVTNLFNTEQYE
jgi:hypothetical protein